MPTWLPSPARPHRRAPIATSGSPSEGREDGARGRGVHREAVDQIVVERDPVGAERAPVPGDDEVVGPPLVGQEHVVVDVGRRPAPRDGHGAVEGQPERDAARPVVVRRRVRVVHRQREDDRHQTDVAEHVPAVHPVLPAAGRPQRGDEQPRGDDGEDDGRPVPDPERDPSRARPQRQHQQGVHHDDAAGDAHPAVEHPPLGRVDPRQRPQGPPRPPRGFRHRDHAGSSMDRVMFMEHTLRFGRLDVNRVRPCSLQPIAELGRGAGDGGRPRKVRY